MSVVVATLQEGLDCVDVARFGGADEVVISDVYVGPGFFEPLTGDVGLFLGRAVVALGSFFDFMAVFVGARHEKDFVSQQTLPARYGVCCDGGVGVPYVGGIVDVEDGCGKEEFCHFSSLSMARRGRVFPRSGGRASTLPHSSTARE